MLEGIECKTSCNYFDDRDYFDSIADKVVYSGAIDEYFGYRLGHLEYRSLRFETETLPVSNYQGNAIVNYTDHLSPLPALWNTSILISTTMLCKKVPSLSSPVNIHRHGQQETSHTTPSTMNGTTYSTNNTKQWQNRKRTSSLVDDWLNIGTTIWMMS